MSLPVQDVPEADPLELEPEPSASRRARKWTADVLSGWPEERVDVVSLLVSELVTNAVLHARSAITVRCRPDGERMRFEVVDRHPALPSPKRFSPGSPTGRGMVLVASLSDDWGITRHPDGKTIWFSLSRSTDSTVPVVPVDVDTLARELQVMAASGQGGSARMSARIPEADVVSVVILGIPLEVYLEAEQHNDAVMRELALIVQPQTPARTVEVPRRLLELAQEVGALFSGEVDSIRTQVEDAIADGRQTVDLHVAVPRNGWRALLRLADWLEEVDRYCEEGDMLTLTSSPTLRRFRAWYAGQVAEQMEGRPPTPWDAAQGCD